MRESNAYFILPTGAYYRRVSLGAALRTVREPISHNAIAEIAGLNPAATHLEFTKATGLFAMLTDTATARDARIVGLPVYVFTRALRHVGPPVDNTWAEVPLLAERVPA